MQRLPAPCRFVLLTATAFWLAVVGTGASMVHSHDDGPGGSSPHRHLILFGVECPAELPADGDGPGDSHATAALPRDADEPAGGELVVGLELARLMPPAASFHVPQDSPPAPPERTPSPRATRTAVLRA